MSNLQESFEASVKFEMDQSNENLLLREMVKGLLEKCGRLQSELRNCRNELCLKCDRYHEAHLGACDDCRYMHNGDWERDME